MTNRIAAVLASAAFLLPLTPAYAANPMGYQLLSPQEASGLPHNHGALGLDVERSQQITDGGMTFDVMRVKSVRRGSPGAQVGFTPGDQLIAVDGRVFPTIATFAAYIGSVQPGGQVSIDYIPSGGGPQQAQRIAVTLGGAMAPVQAQQAPPPAQTGMSMGTKVAIGAGAVALLGCYELGCFNHKAKAAPMTPQRPPMQQPMQQQQMAPQQQ